MIIQCEKCQTKFKIDSSRIKPSGSNVRCSKCGHIFTVSRDEPVLNQTDPELPGLIDKEPQQTQSPTEEIQDETQADVSPAQDISAQEDEKLDIQIDRAPKDSGNWEDFVSISKTGAQESGEVGEPDQQKEPSAGSDEFNWNNLNIDEDEPNSNKPDIPEMFEEEEQAEVEEKSASKEPKETYEEVGRNNYTLDDERQDEFKDIEGYYTKASEETMHRGSVYGKKSSSSGVIGKIISTILIAAVFVVIIAASAAILINLELIPQEQITRTKALIESVIPIKLSKEPTPGVIITNHGGNWVNTRYGPLYVVSGTIQNVSDVNVHYVQIRSAFTAAGELLYEDTIYAGNTFTENELKLSRTEDVVMKLKKKNGDIDYYNTDKLSGLNYDIKPGQTIPFFAVLPSDRRVLGLKYNLEIVGYLGPDTN